MLGEEQTSDRFTLDDRVFPFLQRHMIQRSVPVGVVAELEAGVEPDVERGDALVDFVQVEIKFALVDEADGRDVRRFQRADELAGHLGDRGGGHDVGGPSGQIIHGDADGALRLSIGPARRGQLRRQAKDEDRGEYTNDCKEGSFHDDLRRTQFDLAGACAGVLSVARATPTNLSAAP
jgi:hypothetical protein